MRALTVLPLKADTAGLTEVPEPPQADGEILCEAVAVGVDGTDFEINAGEYGAAPPGEDRLILCHESLGRVVEAPAGSGFSPGDLLVGVVRRPDPVPCVACAAGEWDMCRNGLYTERGIKERNGFCSERFRIEPHFAIRVSPDLGALGVLVEPASVVAKAWDHVDRAGRARGVWAPECALVIGAGPIGLLAAVLGVQRGLEVHVLDRVVDGPKPDLVSSLGATYHAGTLEDAGRDFDVIVECTGVGPLVLQAIEHVAAGGVLCLTGISSGGEECLDSFALNKDMVLRNVTVIGSVNAGYGHYVQAHDALVRADAGWLDRMITRRVPFARAPEALRRPANDVKTIVEF